MGVFRGASLRGILFFVAEGQGILFRGVFLLDGHFFQSVNCPKRCRPKNLPEFVTQDPNCQRGARMCVVATSRTRVPPDLEIPRLSGEFVDLVLQSMVCSWLDRPSTEQQLTLFRGASIEFHRVLRNTARTDVGCWNVGYSQRVAVT